MTAQELRRLRADKITEAQRLLDAAEAEKRELTEAEEEKYGLLSEEIDGLEKKAARAAKQEVWNAEVRAAGPAPTKPDVDGSPSEPRGFGSIGEFAKAVADLARFGKRDERLFEQRATGMSEGVMADGGFLVKTEESDRLLEKVYNTGQIASRVQRITVGPGANGISIPYINESSRADGSRAGGVRGYWSAEGGTMTASKPAFGKFKLDLDKLTCLMYATDEELEDIPTLTSIINRLVPQELIFKLEDGAFNGSGAGMPLGILNAGCVVSQAKEAGQAAATIVAENVMKMWSRMYAPARAGAVWFINQDCEPQLATMSIAVGTGGVPVYMPAGGLSGSPFGSLYGRPVIPVEYAATLGTVGDIVLANMGEYIVIDKGGVQSASSIHVQFLTNESCFRWVYRVNGKPWWASALTPFKGATNTQSPFITLATRA